MPVTLQAQLISACAGLELLAAVLLVWRASRRPTARWLAVQGGALAGLVAVLAVAADAPELFGVAVFVLALKGYLLPRVLIARAAADVPVVGHRRADPTAWLLGVALLAVLAYVVSRPVAALVPGPAGRAVPVGFAMVLCGFLVLVAQRRAHAQLVGFLMLDNGIATLAFLTADGVPLEVELGASLDVLLVVLVLQVLGGRMERVLGGTDLDDLRELHD